MEAFCAQGSFGHGLCGCYQQGQFTMFRLSTEEMFIAGFETEMQEGIALKCSVKGCHGGHPANKCKKAEHE